MRKAPGMANVMHFTHASSDLLCFGQEHEPSLGNVHDLFVAAA
jgi:hypothetical protein